jgi:hypothetical protein
MSKVVKVSQNKGMGVAFGRAAGLRPKPLRVFAEQHH